MQGEDPVGIIILFAKARNLLVEEFSFVGYLSPGCFKLYYGPILIETNQY